MKVEAPPWVMSVMMGSGKREAVVSQPQPPHRDGGAEDEDAAKSSNKLYVCFFTMLAR